MEAGSYILSDIFCARQERQQEAYVWSRQSHNRGWTWSALRCIGLCIYSKLEQPTDVFRASFGSLLHMYVSNLLPTRISTSNHESVNVQYKYIHTCGYISVFFPAISRAIAPRITAETWHLQPTLRSIT